MDIEQWWPRLDPATREWLIAHNGDVVPREVVAEIAGLPGTATANASWLGAVVPHGVTLTDAAVDWIEEVANA